ncbi:MAG: hypothetical protein KGD63_05570 [Candidatus Lokiarchaeota archaeon]|nr:hypothetical protein [Candidatus Lokiarchaeota archaeon]
MLFQTTGLQAFFEGLSKLGALFMLFLGVIWIIYGVHETKRRGSFKKRKTEDWDFKITKFLKILTYVGFVVGILSIVAGVGALMYDEPPSVAYGEIVSYHRNIFTCIILLLLGFVTFLKPANDLPMATIIGLLISLAITFLVAMMIPEEIIGAIDEFVDYKIVLGIVFLILFAISALVAKFYTAGFMFISKVFSWPPIAIIVALLCLIQGTLLLTAGISLI